MHRKLAWACRVCKWLTVSDTREHRKMDSCACGQSSIDLEEAYTRGVGFPQPVAVLYEDGDWTHVTNDEMRRELKKQHIKYFNDQVNELVELLRSSGVEDVEIQKMIGAQFKGGSDGEETK